MTISAIGESSIHKINSLKCCSLYGPQTSISFLVHIFQMIKSESSLTPPCPSGPYHSPTGSLLLSLLPHKYLPNLAASFYCHSYIFVYKFTIFLMLFSYSRPTFFPVALPCPALLQSMPSPCPCP